ncbi:MAG: SpoIIE family protein phosphatase [Acetatifactor sp.]|nr:SpoIIE family protein phosphatase [Acetatifactor sp.]
MEFAIDWRQRQNKGKEWTSRMPELCRQRLLGYAESFRELSKGFDGEFIGDGLDRMEILEERRLWESRQVMSSSLNAVAQIMTQVAEEVVRYEPFPEKRRKAIAGALRAEGIYIDHLCYLPGEHGRKAVGMTMYTDKKGGQPAEEVADMLSVLLHRQVQLSVTSPYLIDRISRSFVFVEEASYIALTGFARAVKEDETLSGDHYSLIESEKGRMTVLLSDGTGSGERASADSERVLDLMEKMLEAGYSLETAVGMVNTAFFAKGEENGHPTLDICDLDLYQGCCDFCKAGGVTSFVKRGAQVEQVTVENLPLGIFQTVEARKIHKELHSGDYVIMMTDGVLDVLGENGYEEAMAEAIGSLREQNPGEIAERLLEQALCAGGGRIQDDMTILVIGLWENSNLS